MSVGSPWQWLALVEEAASGPVIWQRGQPHGGVGGSVRTGSERPAARRVGSDDHGLVPTGADAAVDHARTGCAGGSLIDAIGCLIVRRRVSPGEVDGPLPA